MLASALSAQYMTNIFSIAYDCQATARFHYFGFVLSKRRWQGGKNTIDPLPFITNIGIGKIQFDGFMKQGCKGARNLTPRKPKRGLKKADFRFRASFLHLPYVVTESHMVWI